jgi:hypothetical protein
MKLSVAPSRLTLSAALLIAVSVLSLTARAKDTVWVGMNNGNWNTTGVGTWDTFDTATPPAIIDHVPPDAGFDEAARIDNNTTVVLSAQTMSANTAGGTLVPVDIGGLKLATTAANFGGLRVTNGGRLTAVDPGGSPSTETGAIQVGVAGQGILTILGGGMVTGTSIALAGANNSSITLGDTSGLTATLTTSGTANLGRITTVIGQNVNFNSTGNLTLGGTGTLVADIRSATAHSALKTDGNATVGGTLRPLLTGFTPAAGNKWSLVDAVGTVTGNFSTVDTSGVTLPNGLAFRVVPGTNGARNTRDLTIEEVLVLQVNRDTGAVSIANVGAQNKNIDGYSILSPNSWLSTTAWNSLDDQNVGGADAWVEAGPAANALSELNPGNVGTGFTTVNAGTSLALGSPYDSDPATFPPLGTDPDNLVFEYSGPDGRTILGQVVYSGTKVHNDLVLTVDPSTGMAAMKNDSPHTVIIDGYNVASASGSLVPGTWNSLDDQNVEGWEEASPTANALAELRATGALTLTPGTGFGLGQLFKTVGATQDLEFGFLQQGNGNLTIGTVVYGAVTIPPPPGGGVNGDFNDNGVVDAADYVLWRNGGPLMNDPTPGVQPGDYDTWKANFGKTGGAGSAAATAVPEPSTLLLVCLALVGHMVGVRRTIRQG